MHTWAIYALLAALFAGLQSILAKIGIENVNPNLATAVRTVVVLVLAWSVVLATGAQSGLQTMGQRNWIFLTLSGFATGLSWLFFYRALQIGLASRVVPVDKISVVISMILAFVILGEPFNAKTIVGGLLITIGTIVLVL